MRTLKVKEKGFLVKKCQIQSYMCIICASALSAVFDSPHAGVKFICIVYCLSTFPLHLKYIQYFFFNCNYLIYTCFWWVGQLITHDSEICRLSRDKRDKKSDLLCASYAVRLKCEYSLICMKVKVLVNGWSLPTPIPC